MSSPHLGLSTEGLRISTSSLPTLSPVEALLNHNLQYIEDMRLQLLNNKIEYTLSTMKRFRQNITEILAKLPPRAPSTGADMPPLPVQPNYALLGMGSVSPALVPAHSNNSLSTNLSSLKPSPFSDVPSIPMPHHQEEPATPPTEASSSVHKNARSARTTKRKRKE